MDDGGDVRPGGGVVTKLNKLPEGAGDTLENIGGAMVAVAIIIGLVSILVFARVPEARGYFSVSYKWNAGTVWVIALTTLWSVGFSWAIMRIGTALRWLEAMGKKNGIE